ncbi:MAG: thioredoxin family protein [Candidatus Micrarchaeota archaeon]|nr:thioredoxin family protein [Candidatus Micrarchaeota archaeon]
MEIAILGPGCSRCKELERRANEAAHELGIKADVVEITDIAKIIDFGVMSTPAIVIDGKVKASGRIPEVNEIKGWLSP